MDFLKKLNKEQLKAVETFDVPLLISAGAGSGKTRVITYKIAYLIHKLNISPDYILGLAFTNKASQEMKKRIRQFLHNKKLNLWINTFHSMCTIILRKELRSNFIIIDENDKKGILREIVKELNLDKDIYNINLINNTISRFKTLKIPYTNPNYTDDVTETLKDIFNIYKQYEELKKKQNYFDFDDLLIKTIQLFYQNKHILEKYRKKFQYILVDEFQDTNEFQYNLIYLLGYDKKNITIVGDPDQSIYSWRGACIDNFKNFLKDFKNCRTIKLEQNYRSTNNILKAAASVIQVNSSYDNKILWSKKKKGKKVQIFTCPTIEDESDFLVHKIKELRKDGYKFKDIAFFCRTNYYYQNLEFALRTYNIPYKIIGGLKFFEKYEIKNLLAYLKFLNNPKDTVSLLRIINCPSRGIGKMTVDRLKQISLQENKDLYYVLVNYERFNIKKNNALLNFISLINDFQLMKKKRDLNGLASGIIKRINYIEYLKKFPEYEIRLNNVDEFLNDIKDFVKLNKELILKDYINKVSLLSDIDEIDEFKENEEYVHIITIHNAKGLEFKVVFIIGMQEGMFPHYKVLQSKDSNNSMEEERRLFYVGLTRAEEEVYLTNPQYYRFFGKEKVTYTSRFISEINPEYVEYI